MPRSDVRRRQDEAKVGRINGDIDRLYTGIVGGGRMHEVWMGETRGMGSVL